MSDGTKIEWADASWQPQVGCTRTADPGCQNCYAVNTIHRFRKADGLTKLRPKEAARPGLDWSGKVLQQPERLGDPLRWKKPRRIFVCSQSDLFHESTPFEYIATVFGVMAACPQHTFLVLTKRPERAREFFAWLEIYGNKHGMAVDYVPWFHARDITGGVFDRSSWPLRNVHLGVSVSDQATADDAIPELLECPAHVHWVSYEPALGPVNFFAFLKTPLRDECLRRLQEPRDLPGLKTIVIGGESGPRSREFRIEWARDVIRQVAGTNCTAYVKQLGSKPRQPASDVEPGGLGTWTLTLVDRKGGDMSEWPADLRVREWAT